MQFDEATRILGVGDDFTMVELTAAARMALVLKTGNAREAFKALTSEVQNLEVRKIVLHTEGKMTSELGRGLGLYVSADGCQPCGGYGYQMKAVDEWREVMGNCKDCEGRGYFSYACKQCEGSGKLEKGKCFLCKRVPGRFVPSVKDGKGAMFFAKIKRSAYPCHNCEGKGKMPVMKHIKSNKKVHTLCGECMGAGETEIFHPIIDMRTFREEGRP